MLKNPHILKITSILVLIFMQFISSDSSDSLSGIYAYFLLLFSFYFTTNYKRLKVSRHVGQ